MTATRGSIRADLGWTFVRALMKHGSRARAVRIFDEAMEEVCLKLRCEDADEILATAIRGKKPLVEIRTRHVDGATCQVPLAIPPARGTVFAIRAIIETARHGRGSSMARKLARALIEAYRGNPVPPDGSTRKVARHRAGDAYRHQAGA